jgi:hypothetical protein
MFGQEIMVDHLLIEQPKLTSIHVAFASVLDVNSELSENEHQLFSETSIQQFPTKP